MIPLFANYIQNHPCNKSKKCYQFLLENNVLLLPYHVRVSITALLLISLSIGSYFKFILYRFIFVSSKLNNGSYFNMSPINSMILNSAVIHHLTHLSTGLLLAMSIGTDIVPEKVFGSGYCKLIFLIGN